MQNFYLRTRVLNFSILGMGFTLGNSFDGLIDVSPGREFAVNEIKLLLAFTLLRYDVKTKEGKRPADFVFSTMVLPDVRAELLIKRRADKEENHQ
jgi:hypothetical protein